ncbi:hypothetical protein [Bradyrhizobium sp. NAS96.2]|uniref:hypothetical protein n=1 Tax=Bradyrhizobium sp. NAS96.2 TaxID=1680160 RepID=UPI0011612138|nr:hypothetical protein [Bradyrhizobium sp. NAS96.2]
MVALFAVLLAVTRDPVLLRYFVTAALVTVFLYFGLWVVDPASSIVAVLDFYVFGVLFGILGAAACLKRLLTGPFDIRACLLSPVAVLIAFFNLGILYQDFFHAPLVLEGRAQNPRVQSRRSQYVVDIANQTVKVTTPVYERLKFNPYVRAEIGRGSNYVYRIDYLSN